MYLYTVSKISEIINGWGNLVKAEFNLLPLDIMKMAERRLLICHECPIRNQTVCNPMAKARHIITGKIIKGCGCVLAAKTLSTDEDTVCPMGKW